MRPPLTIGIRYRLFLAFLAATCCVVVSMFLVTRFSFERGTLRYVKLVEKERLEILARSLEQAYAVTGRWDFLGSSPAAWMELVVGSRPHPPPHHKGDRRLGMIVDGHDPALEERPPPPPLPKGNQLFELRVLLLDEQRRILAGQPEPWPQPPYFLPLKAGDRTIGYLGLIPPRLLADSRIQQFVREQNRSLMTIALTIATLAALLAIPLAHRLVRRITGLAAATNRLASGEYDIRVPAQATDELGQLARDFNRLAHTLGRNEQLRRRWVADISHELRTPLSVLRGEIEAVQDGVRPMTSRTMEVLHGEVLHLGRLVEDLYDLSLADIGALTFHKEQLDLAELTGQAVEAHRDQFKARNLSLEYVPEVGHALLEGDRIRLRQLLDNLLENSLRYTDPGGCLRISLQPQNDRLHLAFADTAPGVPEEALAHLFERLYRVEDSRNRAHGGAGLGLALCRSIVEGHGGEIMAAPSPLGGLAITITLPRHG